MNITIIGTGYVGLVTGTCFAEMGHRVICVDVDREKIELLREGKISIYEPGLEHLVHRNSKAGRLSFSTDIARSIQTSQAIFIAVGTPPAEDGSADLNNILALIELIGENLKKSSVVILKSTAPVGTARKIASRLAAIYPEPFDMVSNPEFLREGTAVSDFLKPDRVVIGVSSERGRLAMEDIYAPFVKNNHPLLFMDLESAEVTKYASNAILATRISFINEIANFCGAVGADVESVRRGMGADHRIGSTFLYPGIGYGGSCFPKDVRALIRTAEEHGFSFDLLKTVENINERQKHLFFHHLKSRFQGNLQEKTVALWGLAFKPDTDDVRESAALALGLDLIRSGCRLKVNDPEAMTSFRRAFSHSVEYFEDPYEAAREADALILCTEWPQYRNPDFSKLHSLMRTPIILDGRNIYTQIIPREDFEYLCIGGKSR